MTKSIFTVGQKVNALALPNAIPTPREAILGLTVTKITKIQGYSNYYRIVAEDGFRLVEGAEWFFESVS